jgi:PAS domain S-box-containing protein
MSMNLEQLGPHIFVHLHDAMLVADRQGRCVAVNPAFCTLTGYTAGEIMETDLREFLAPEEVENVVKWFRRRRAGKEAPQVYETGLLHKDGKTRIDVSVDVEIIHVEGQPNVIGIVHDITERKRAEKRLRESEEKHRATFESTGTATVIIEEDTTLSLVNAQFEKLSGYPREEIEGRKSWTEFVVKDDLDRMREYHSLRRIDEHAAPRNYEFGFIDKYGGLKDILLTIAMIPGTKKSVASLLDITERAQAEEALRQRQREFESLLETDRDLSSILDLNELLSLIAQRAISLLDADEFALFRLEEDATTLRPILALGEYADEMMDSPLQVGQGITGYGVAHNQPVLANDAQDDPRAAHVPGTPEQEQEHIMVAPLIFRDKTTGAMMVNRVAKQPFTEENLNLFVGFAGQAAIAVENARLHTEVQRHAEELERRVEERTAELRQALIRAQESDRAKSDFISIVNHELRTPLSNLKLYTRLLREGYAEKRDRYLDTLDREIDRLSALVEDTLTLARLDRQEPPKREQLNLVEIMRDAMTRFTALADSRHIDLIFNPPDHDIDIQAESGQIMRVLTNLLGNALTYTPADGAVTLGVEARKAGSGQWAILSVKDTGPGIPLDEQRHIFTRFHRGQAGRDSGVPGSGLGLAIVKEIVQLHHGAVRVDSAPGTGTTFYVWLPLI